MISDLISLTKPRLSALVFVTAGIGALLAPEKQSLLVFALALLGTLLIVASGCAFNCILEKDIDKLMHRTATRPLPSGRMSTATAFVFATLLLVSGTYFLYTFSNPLTLKLGLAAFFIYVCLYTPLKRVSNVALFLGAIPGAIPPAMGWTAMTGQIETGALILFWILFFWQIPHFIAIAFYHQKEYQKAGLKTLPGTFGKHQAHLQLIIFAVAMVVASISPYFFALAGIFYIILTMCAGIAFMWLCLYSFRELKKTTKRMRFIFFATLVYLPVVLGTWVIDQYLDIWIRSYF